MKLTHSTLALLLAIVPQLQAAEKVDRTIKVDSKPKVELEVPRGEVNLVSWNKSEVRVEGTLDEESEGLELEQRGGVVHIRDKANLRRKHHNDNKDGSKLTLYLPKELSLSAEGISTDYRLKDFSGKLELSSVSGNIQSESLSGEVALNTVSGDIKAKALKGELYLITVSGAIMDEDSSGEVNYQLVSGDLKGISQGKKISIEQVSGEVKFALPKAEQLRFSTVSGDSQLRVPGKLDAKLESVSGDLELSFDGKADSRFSINGGPSGDIHNKLSGDKPAKPKYGRGSKLEFSAGSGAGRIDISTISGDITLKQ
ncbi:DUF4097 family beta strand repeat-containing protein [Shewanella sedimentimangrovi]|uniref:DUF4097 family beta strand repeat protein n=1 Tax=Shewanella sedimentimangrovi TaxID=2814293 RepID=A0ABX7QZ73_9GAMM|nr:DUF4097 family beta strand repeat-containing protein [Shewanella sedimentimangrovi]QSX36352.1 DUF4097 family beta strand repeat protein [Shewanella sedimentimangrovi]